MHPTQLISQRPWLYHMTSRENLGIIRNDRRLKSAASLLASAGLASDARVRRRTHRRILVNGHECLLRDQAPLHPGNIALDDDSTFDDVVELLNRFVFFWPGTDAGPSDYGNRHFRRYESERPVVLRVPTADLMRSTTPRSVRLCRYNSGAPRCSGGRKSPRGRSTFIPMADFPDRVGDVVEVVVETSAILPSSTQLGETPVGPFDSL
jgi:hypothetical protein